jgi:maltose alpha-D-glucosyltransferase/alpha-amylase
LCQGPLDANLKGIEEKANKTGKHRIMLEGYAYRWYRIGGLDYLLRRTDIDQKDTAVN